MKKYLIALLAIATLVACNETPTPEPEPTPGPGEEQIDPKPNPETPDFEILVHEDGLTAWGVTFDVKPSKAEAPYYFDIISKARLSEVNAPALKEELNTSAEKLASFTGATKEEVLESLLSVGDKLDVVSDAGYKGGITYCIYAFYWNDEDGTEVTTCEFTTPAPKESSESLAVTFSEVDSYSMQVQCAPSAGVERYYYYFEESAKVEQMFRQLEDDNAYLSYHAMNVGTLCSGAQTFKQEGLKPEVAYTVLVMAIDNKGNRFLVEEMQTTPATATKERVESELFEALLGEWAGTHSVTDLYTPAAATEFNVTIVSAVEGYDFDYRAENQLVALVDGWCNIAYYSVADLIEFEIEDPEEKFGPKWVFDIAEGDVVTMDGKAHHSTVGWMFFGDCYVLSAKSDGTAIYTDSDFNVTVSADKNTITISSPVADSYPALCYNFEGFGWMGYQYGCSDIVLTRK